MAERQVRKSPRLADFDYSETRAYHVTVVTLKRTPIFEQPIFASSVLETMRSHHQGFGYRLHVFALMPDHLHLLINPTGSSKSLNELVGGLKSMTTRALWTCGWEGKVWQERFHDHILRDHEDPRGVAAYILENPVRAGLVAVSSEYAFCGLVDPLE
jgi:REP element-mobilizing transposase RayT